MKCKNITLVTYDNILGMYVDKKLPQKISFAITKNVIVIAKELEAYQKSLEKIVSNYKDYFVKDDNGNVKNLQIGVPEVNSEYMDNYIADIDELLNLETDINLYQIDRDVFDYQDSERYDAMSAKDIIALQNILCAQSENKE